MEYSDLYDKYRSANAVALATALDTESQALDILSAQKSEKEIEKEFLRVRLAEQLAEEGLASIKLASGAKFRVQEEMYVSATAEFKPAVIQVLKDSGNGGIVKEDFNAMTFKSLIKQLKPSDEGFPDPLLQELVQAGVKIKVVPMARRY